MTAHTFREIDIPSLLEVYDARTSEATAPDAETTPPSHGFDGNRIAVAILLLGAQIAAYFDLGIAVVSLVVIFAGIALGATIREALHRHSDRLPHLLSAPQPA